MVPEPGTTLAAADEHGPVRGGDRPARDVPVRAARPGRGSRRRWSRRARARPPSVAQIVVPTSAAGRSSASRPNTREPEPPNSVPVGAANPRGGSKAGGGALSPASGVTAAGEQQRGREGPGHRGEQAAPEGHGGSVSWAPVTAPHTPAAGLLARDRVLRRAARGRDGQRAGGLGEAALGAGDAGGELGGRGLLGLVRLALGAREARRRVGGGAAPGASAGPAADGASTRRRRNDIGSPRSPRREVSQEVSSRARRT